ncbi:MAG: RluA family pseudouridine synthase [Ruminococcaceae bacterium]|nr:RluA family pseudouridine synthase [Oscillospiraceae bacterium]
MTVLFDDKDFVVCIKPAGLLSEDGDGALPQILRERLDCDIFPVHRLDRGTGGLMVYAKSSSAAAKLSSAITEGKFIKRYLTVVRGIPDADEAVLKDLLYHDRRKNKSFVVKHSRAGVKEASLYYKLLSTVNHNGAQLSLLDVQLHTGRTHQIRVQFSSRRLPLYGDGKYGGRTEKEGMALWSYSLSFPWMGKMTEFTAKPVGTPWCLFEELL